MARAVVFCVLSTGREIGVAVRKAVDSVMSAAEAYRFMMPS